LSGSVAHNSRSSANISAAMLLEHKRNIECVQQRWLAGWLAGKQGDFGGKRIYPPARLLLHQLQLAAMCPRISEPREGWATG
jgi:hypothetical protein